MLDTGSRDIIFDRICGSRSPRKAGMTSNCILNLIGLLKYAQLRKNNSKLKIIKAGFTLVELSITLVIIGLLAGGILVGNDLIKAAEVRSQISQIEKYSAATNTFKVKYNNHLPGDIPEPDASAFGFVDRGSYIGDGNGLIVGELTPTSGQNCSECQQGETAMFWVDLSTANLINKNFTAAIPNGLTFAPITKSTNPSLQDYFPISKLGANSYFHIYSTNGQNYFVMSSIVQLGNAAYVTANPSLSAAQAYNIDTKIDDGLPQSGTVQAKYLNPFFVSVGATSTAATPSSATTCYDNGNVAGATQKYSIGTNGRNGVNCALSFKFQ